MLKLFGNTSSVPSSLNNPFATDKVERIFISMSKCLQFDFKGSTVRFFPYTGWFSGKTIKDGRGLNNLLKQVRG